MLRHWRGVTAVQGATPSEKRCKKWTYESAAAGQGCTRVDGRVGGRASKEVLYLEESVCRRLGGLCRSQAQLVRKISEQAENVTDLS